MSGDRGYTVRAFVEWFGRWIIGFRVYLVQRLRRLKDYWDSTLGMGNIDEAMVWSLNGNYVGTEQEMWSNSINLGYELRAARVSRLCPCSSGY